MLEWINSFFRRLLNLSWPIKTSDNSFNQCWPVTNNSLAVWTGWFSLRALFAAGVYIKFKLIFLPPPLLDIYFSPTEIYYNEGVRAAGEQFSAYFSPIGKRYMHFPLFFLSPFNNFFPQTCFWPYFCLPHRARGSNRKIYTPALLLTFAIFSLQSPQRRFLSLLKHGIYQIIIQWNSRKGFGRCRLSCLYAEG